MLWREIICSCLTNETKTMRKMSLRSMFYQKRMTLKTYFQFFHQMINKNRNKRGLKKSKFRTRKELRSEF